MENSHIHSGRLRHLLIFRLLLVTLLLGALLLFELIWPQESGAIPASLYCFVIFTYLVTIFYSLRLNRVANASRFIYQQLMADATLIAVLLYLTGGFYSLFFPLFYFIILGGTLYLERHRVIILLFYCTFLYLLVIFAHIYNPFQHLLPLPPLVSSNHKVVSKLFFNLAPFYLTAFILHFIAKERLDTIQRLEKVTSDLEEFKDLNQHIIASIDSGLITTDRQLTINSINQAGCTILGHKRNAILYRSLHEVINNLPAATDIADSGRQRHEISYQHPSGQQLILGFAFTPLKKMGDQELGWILIFQDLTELKKIEERLQEANKMAAIGRLAAGIAHEIRNPLAAITGSIEILAEDLPEKDETHHRLLAIILKESSRLNNLISDFLSFSRLENREQIELDLLALLRDVVFIFRSQFPRISFREEYHSQSFTIRANPDQLEQIFWNLLKNATEATSEKGEIVLSSQASQARFPAQGGSRKAQSGGPDGIEISITDNGPGLDPKIADKIFEPFFTTKSSGTGLGLYITFQLTRIHNGNIQIGKRDDNIPGTSVRLSFPGTDNTSPDNRKKSGHE
ncbi:MAG: PAS domain S-box protein [Deltaproteobacteria bacterium]|nr:PAS domain S-box protein [Deltaproteobacteria bacterium]